MSDTAFEGTHWSAGAGQTPGLQARKSVSEIMDALPEIEADAWHKFASHVWARTSRRGKSSRNPEGYFDGDTAKWVPTVREDCGRDPPRPAPPRHFKKWSHIYALCMRALAGFDVPADIAKWRDELWPKVHERFYDEKVKESQKAEDVKFKRQQLAAAKAEKRAQAKAAANSRTARIAKAEAAVARYDEGIKRLEAKVKALETRKKRALRSIAALKRQEGKA